METVTLFRPVGQAELNLIHSTGRFPPRLPIQPIFYPVTTFEYAEKIACDWNTKDAASGYIGYITEFKVKSNYLSKYPVQNAGGSDHQEYWIPAEELEEFNDNIVGGITVVASYSGTS
ncbi:hypothetical protein CCB80_03460 [Armatimonadetes bacterium Uphvl-Ar1]|nr:hypothetical protein CCB80_03460 [Armatimonadetes bacterium Uphvl-Ar1]